MIDKTKVYALVGASNNTEKYGNKVFKDLYNAGIKVIPINIKEDIIEGVKAYHSLREFPGVIDIVIFVVPPTATESVLNEVKDLGISTVWMQPGSESEAAINFCERNSISCTHNACIMIERQK